MFEVLNYVHENITKPLTVLDTANYFGYSKWYFPKKFREFKGVTFGEYVRHYRIQLAAIDVVQGREFNGLDTVLNSISKLPTKRTPGTTSAIVEVDPKLFTDRNIGSLTDILIAAGKKVLSNVQFNTIDAETLIL